ncbi:EAL domain-containing protein [Pseudoalteromonas sp. C8]|uniref:bifunctional diguanylate cyclase/phosphodiesterase n=1 Tax=Pseudoalteromonas sp. C8 TaxID=2686345 RepID=UPI0013FDE477|nr:EAL domain-containing protein [Pseudoalteromonas sp. C8]
MKLVKKMPLIYFIFVGITSGLFSLATWHQWTSLNSSYELQQTYAVNRFASSVDSLLGTQSMFLMFIEEHILAENGADNRDKTKSELSRLVNSNIDIAMISLYLPNGQLDLSSSRLNVEPILNLLENEETRDSFKQTLNSNDMVLGRTYRVGDRGQLVFPLRKTIRTATGEPSLVISMALRVNDARLFNDHQHYADINVLVLLRDDGYRQFISSKEDHPNAYNIKPVLKTNQLRTAAVDYIKSRYPFPKTKYKPYQFYTGRSQVVTARLDSYGLWVNSRIFKSDIRAEFIPAYLVQLFVFISSHILLHFIVRHIIRKEMKRQGDLFYQAHHDELTKLPNKQYFQSNLSKWLKSTRRPFSMILINIDRFRLINDNYGHQSGDHVLQYVAFRLKTLLQNGDLLIRYTGDEFILITSKTNTSELYRRASGIITALGLPYKLGESELPLSSSIGIAKYPEHGDTLTLLLRSANIAMVNSKKERNIANMFSFSMEKSYMHRLLIEERLRIAAQEGSFYMVYQPQIDTQNHLYGVEALVRWEDEKLGFISPDKFIPIAEFCGLMPKIGQHIINTTLSEISSLQRELELPFQIAINISAQQFCHVGFFEMLLEAVKHNKVAPTLLTIEITESLFINDIEKVLPILNQLREAGLSISLDDFGTGYSSLSMLRTLPIDELKIDKSFVDDILNDVRSLKMVQNIISIGKNLNLSILAEGIEIPEQEQSLIDCGCDLFQGYHYSKPLLKTDLYQYVLDKSFNLNSQ